MLMAFLDHYVYVKVKLQNAKLVTILAMILYL